MSEKNETQQEHATIYCGELSPNTISADIKKLFNEVSPVLWIKLRKRDDNRSSYCFVGLPSQTEADEIIKKFQFYELHSKQIILSMCSEDRNIDNDSNVFVKNLPKEVTTKDLYSIFAMFGDIVSCKIATNPDGESKGFGYVQFKTHKMAKKAISKCINTRIGDNVLKVELYNKDIKDISRDSSFTNVYMKNFPKSYTEDDLKKLLESDGRIITSVYFPTNSDGTPIGHALANFDNPDDAKSAITKYHDQYVFTSEEMGKGEGLEYNPFYIQRAVKRSDRVESLRKELRNLGISGPVQSKPNLYVTNIPETFSKSEMLDLFKKFGKVQDIKIGFDKAHSTKQYCLVCYSNSEEATIAFEKGNEIFLDGNRLTISYYKNKEERKYERRFDHLGNISNFGQSINPTMMFSAPNLATQPDIATGLYSEVQRAILRVAPDFKDDWALFSARDELDFADIFAKFISKLNSNEISNLVDNSTALTTKIEDIVANRREQLGN